MTPDTFVGPERRTLNYLATSAELCCTGSTSLAPESFKPGFQYWDERSIDAPSHLPVGCVWSSGTAAWRMVLQSLVRPQ